MTCEHKQEARIEDIGEKFPQNYIAKPISLNYGPKNWIH